MDRLGRATFDLQRQLSMYTIYTQTSQKGIKCTKVKSKVELVLEQREVASKICEKLNFSREIQIFTNFAG